MHTVIHPTQIATGVLTVREELSRHVSKSLPGAVQTGNVNVLRNHLEQHTYVSGTHSEAPRRSYRDYRARGAGANRWQDLAR